MTRTRLAAALGLAVIALLGVVLAGGFVFGVGDQHGAGAVDRQTGGDGGADLAGAGGHDVDFDASEKPRATTTPAPAREPASDDADDPVLDTRKRARIKTGELTMQVEDFESTRQSLARATTRHGGYVSDVSRRQHRRGNRTWTTGSVTLRVPAENFSRLRESANGSGILLREDVSTRDVTEQLVDLNARIENLERQRDRLRTMYERANETEELLAIQSQLSDVQGEIERLEARRTELRQQVSYSTLTVELREPEPGAPQIDPLAYHERPLLEAFAASVNGVIVLGRSAIVTAAYALPYLIVLGVIGLPVWIWRRRYGGR